MTTGQPIRVPSDRNKFDNEFMENLRLQIKLNDANLQANRLYTNTGQLPPSVQMADTRSTSEKLADIEGLKRSIVADLSPIAEPSFAFAIIEGVLNSPLNVNNTLFRYLAQNAPMFAQQLSKKYKFGISGDANDVQIIIQFLEEAYSQTSEKFQSIKNYINSSSNINNNVSLQDSLIKEFSDWTYKLEDIQRRSQGMAGTDRNVLNLLKEMIAKVRFYLPTGAQMETIMKESTYFNLSPVEQADLINTGFNPINPDGAPIRRQDLIRDMAEIIRKLPSISRVKTLINLINKSIKQNSSTSFNSSVMNLRNLFEDWLLPDNGILTPAQDTVRQFRQAFLAPLNAQLREEERVNRVNSINQIEAMNQNQERDAKAQRVYVINPNTDPVNVNNMNNPNIPPAGNVPARPLPPPVINIPPAPISLGSMSSSSSSSSSDDGSSQQSYLQGVPSIVSSITAPSSQGSNPTFQDVQQGGLSSISSGSYERTDFGDLPSLAEIDLMRNSLFERRRNQEISIDDFRRQMDELNNLVMLHNSGNNLPPTQSPVGASTLPVHTNTRNQYIYNAVQNLSRKDLENLFDQVYAYDKSNPPSEAAMRISLGSHLTDMSVNDYDPRQIGGNRTNAFGIGGLGINKKVKVGRGISSDYRDFGINKINHKKLDDGILTLRRKSNTNIPDMPSKRISRKLQKIIKHISGGGMPDFNDINNLENGEKDYLHKLITKSNLQERLSVPAPSKDQEEKDFHQFEVMKGEIMSGNDSKELVKKFKILILKLSKQNILPKNEVQELLQDLLSLGY
jgi:hypothetical protein